MANFTHTLGVTYKTDAGTIASTTVVYSGDDESNFNETIAPSSTNVEFDWTMALTGAQSLCIFATAAMTIKTNSSGTPLDTITLTAGQQMVWTHDSGLTSPFSHAAVTKLFVTSAAGGLLKIRALLNVAA